MIDIKYHDVSFDNAVPHRSTLTTVDPSGLVQTFIRDPHTVAGEGHSELAEKSRSHSLWIYVCREIIVVALVLAKAQNLHIS